MRNLAFFLTLFMAGSVFGQPVSTFDSNDEGWQTTSDAKRYPVPDYFPTGGNPGGYISATDNTSGIYFYFNSPAGFLGDQSLFLGDTLYFDLMVNYLGDANPSLADIRIQGAGFDLVYNFGSPSAAGQWVSYTIPLSAASGWKKTSLTGGSPSESEFLAALSSLTLLQIRGEYTTNVDIVGLDNVRIGWQTVPVELVSLSGSQSGNIVTLIWSTASETNNFGWEVERQEVRSQKSENRFSTGSQTENWEKVGFVAGNGTTTEPQSYRFSSPVPSPLLPAVFRLKQIDLDGTVSFSKILTVTVRPERLALLQNYPNPFNPETQLRFYLPEAEKVTLSVLDITGRTVAVLVKNSGFQAGGHAVSFSGKELSTGIYLTRLEVGGKVLTSKIMLMK